MKQQLENIENAAMAEASSSDSIKAPGRTENQISR